MLPWILLHRLTPWICLWIFRVRQGSRDHFWVVKFDFKDTARKCHKKSFQFTFINTFLHGLLFIHESENLWNIFTCENTLQNHFWNFHPKATALSLELCINRLISDKMGFSYSHFNWPFKCKKKTEREIAPIQRFLWHLEVQETADWCWNNKLPPWGVFLV